MRNLDNYVNSLKARISIPEVLSPAVATAIVWVEENLKEVFSTADGFIYEFTEENDQWIIDIETKLIDHVGSFMTPEEHFESLVWTVSGIIGADPDYSLTPEEDAQATHLAASIILLAMRSVMLQEQGI